MTRIPCNFSWAICVYSMRGVIMQSSKVHTKDCVYVSQSTPYKNYYGKTCLICETFCNGCCQTEEEEKDILVKFNFCESPVPYSLKKAVLVLPVMNYSQQQPEKCFTLNIFKNLQNYNAKGVVWHTKPAVELYKREQIFQTELKSGKIEIDITPLVWQWITGEAQNYGLTLHIDTCGCRVVVDNNGINSTYLQLSTYQECIGYCNPAIQLQCTNKKHDVLHVDQAIIYNQIITCTSSGFYIDKSTGDIIVQKPGYYNFQWTTEFLAEDDLNEVDIAIKNMQTGAVIPFACPISAKNECAGNAIVQCMCPMQKFRLINNSSKAIHLANTSVQSNLVVMKI